MVALAHMSNAVGTIHDINLLARKAHSVGALFLVDGAQGACHLNVNAAEVDCDFYALSAHKMLVEPGAGVLYGKRKLLEEMDPFLGGGDMIRTVSRDSIQAAEIPMKFEAGTPNIAGVVAFAVALEYLRSAGLEKVRAHEKELVKYAVDELRKTGGVTLYGTEDWDWRGGVVSFNVDGVHPHDVGSILDEEGIAVRVVTIAASRS